MVDKLTAAEATFKEMQMRMGDPEVAANAAEFQRVAKAASDLESIATAFGQVRDGTNALMHCAATTCQRLRVHSHSDASNDACSSHHP